MAMAMLGYRPVSVVELNNNNNNEKQWCNCEYYTAMDAVGMAGVPEDMAYPQNTRGLKCVIACKPLLNRTLS